MLLSYDLCVAKMVPRKESRRHFDLCSFSDTKDDSDSIMLRRKSQVFRRLVYQLNAASMIP